MPIAEKDLRETDYPALNAFAWLVRNHVERENPQRDDPELNYRSQVVVQPHSIAIENNEIEKPHFTGVTLWPSEKGKVTVEYRLNDEVRFKSERQTYAPAEFHTGMLDVIHFLKTSFFPTEVRKFTPI